MKTRTQIAGYLGLLGLTTLVAILYAVRDKLIALAPWVLGLLIAVLGLALAYWLYRLYASFQRMRHGVATQRYERREREQRLLLEQREQEQRLAIEKERWQIERAALLLVQQHAATRIYPDSKGYMPTIVNVSEAEGYQYIQLPHPAHQRLAASAQQPAIAEHAESTVGTLPTNVRYEDIQHEIPRGHVLVGCGLQGVETKPKAIGACVWICGLAGTGKTSTTVLRVHERASDGHVFLGVDPHWFKDDSLFHAVYETLDGAPGPYANRFLLPMACTPEDSLEVLQAFLNEFNGRKKGLVPKPWKPVTLLVDEVGAQMDKATATTPEEKAIIELLPSIARICGQEARNFNMGGIFISQQATGLAWLRKTALMVIIHQLLQESEKKLALNDDPVVMKEMKLWPVGRTYVYGVGFGSEGPRTVQQPYFSVNKLAQIVDADPDEMEPLQPLPSSAIIDFQAQQQKRAGNAPDGALQAGGNAFAHQDTPEGPTLKKMLGDIRKRMAQGAALNTILREDYGIDGGRTHQQIKGLLEAASINESEAL